MEPILKLYRYSYTEGDTGLNVMELPVMYVKDRGFNDRSYEWDGYPKPGFCLESSIGEASTNALSHSHLTGEKPLTIEVILKEKDKEKAQYILWSQLNKISYSLGLKVEAMKEAMSIVNRDWDDAE